ncbi:MAG: helix-turn-helix domain-containing protein [Gammaproteobacteria bacterium]
MKSTDEKKSPEACKRSICPIASALDIVGDKWTLLVVRDLFMGKTTYSELQKSPESIPTNLLADRLKRLEQGGIVARQSYQQKPVRYAYRLTDKGKDLGIILAAMVTWGNRHIPGTFVPDEPDKMFQ